MAVTIDCDPADCSSSLGEHRECEELSLGERSHRTTKASSDQRQRGDVEVAAVVRRDDHGATRGDVLNALDVEACIGEHLGHHEVAKNVEWLEAEDRGDAIWTVPVLDRPPASRCSDAETWVRVDRVRAADPVEQGQIEDAVRAGDAVVEILVVRCRPLFDGSQLAESPDEVAVDLAGVATTFGRIAGGDHVIEPECLSQSLHHVSRRGGGEHQTVAGLPEGCQALRGEGRQDLEQLGHCSTSGPTNLVGLPSLGHSCRSTGECHRDRVLAETVEDGVEERITRERATLRDDPFILQGSVQCRPARLAQECPVQIDERCRHGAKASEVVLTDEPNPRNSKGTTWGVGDPFASIRFRLSEGGFRPSCGMRQVCGSVPHHASALA